MRKRIFLSILVIFIVSTGGLITGCGEDTTGPVISNVSVTEITDSSATVTWTTNEPATSRVEYGTTASYGSKSAFDGTLVTSHSVAVSKLASETVHHFTVKCIDAVYNLSVASDATFTTATDATPNRTAVIQTGMGTIKVELYENRAPLTTANFIGLAEAGFYNGLIFHRIIDDFMIQGGDPEGTGAGGSDETIDLEINAELRHVDGAISMARGQDPNSASSQFFICDGDQRSIRSFLDGSYAVFGQVIDGIEYVRAIAEVETDDADKPLTDVVMTSVTIE